MSVSKKHMADSKLRTAVVQSYLSPHKPTIKQVAQAHGVTFHTAQAMVKETLSPEQLREEKALRYSRSKTGAKNPMQGKRGEQHHNFKGRLSCCPRGYVLVLKPDWYTGRPGSKHIYEHCVVMAQTMGLTEVPNGLVVHHIDEDRTNNSPDNLALVTPQAHRILHARSPLRKLSLWELHRSGTSKSRETTATSPTG